ncbi:hypothetical protein C8R45DRAFT_1174001 [Mycena sanguinolenta]|nr:hypothetical protein C8R45DRAFT_1174001 [Mycena sanguinolenta]
MQIQMKHLISDPSRSCEHRDPVTVLIDGLDECAGLDIQKEILHSIWNLASTVSILLRFIIASRPEPHIYQVFHSPLCFGNFCRLNVEQSFHDVRVYLCDEFARIHRDHFTMANIPSPWPSQDLLESLVQKSSGYFAYASTVIRFVNDENYRPTQRLAMVQDGSGLGSASAFNALDQLYMTILRSARRQPELIPILCATLNFHLAPATLDQLFGFADGDTRLILRSLHSVLHISSDTERIYYHHASLMDFLDSPTRSGDFYPNSPHHRMNLARTILRFCTGQYMEGWTDDEDSSLQYVRPTKNLLRFITSLPPSAELCSLIEGIHPHYIFDMVADVGCMLPWLKKIPSSPPALLKLWEDYAYISSVRKLLGQVPDPDSGWHLISQHFVWSPQLLQVLMMIAFISDSFPRVREVMDITWSELRIMICNFRLNDIGDEQVLSESLLHSSLGGEIYEWASRDLALRYIRMANYPDNTKGLDEEIVHLVRSSRPCHTLLRELWSVRPASIWLDLEDGRYNFEKGEYIIYHVSKWLESFPEPSRELIAFWRQAIDEERSPAEKTFATEFAAHTHQRWEEHWREVVEFWNDKLVHLHLPNNLKIPL